MDSSGKYLLCSCRWNCCCVRYSSILQLLVSVTKQLLFLSLISFLFFPFLHIANNKSALGARFRITNKAWCCVGVMNVFHLSQRKRNVERSGLALYCLPAFQPPSSPDSFRARETSRSGPDLQ